MARRDAEHDQAERFEADAPDWLRIQATPPTLAAGTLPAAELELLSEQQRSGVEGVFDDDAVAGLAESGWLRQDVHVRGTYLSTSGLRRRLDHPELLMLNVPSALVAWAVMTFEGMAIYLDRDGARFEPGETYIELTPAGAGAFTFAELDEKAAESIGFECVEQGLLRVIALP